MSSKATPAERRAELADQRRKVDFDTYDVTVDELIRRVGATRIDIAPAYQRQFRWDPNRQSRLVESILLGIPVPPLFMATNQEEGLQNRWEVVDGLQRLLTLVNFAADSEVRLAAALDDDDPLTLSGLEKLSTFEGARFDTLPEDIQSTLQDRPMKVVVLNDKSDLQVRYDLFERLNTGGIRLTAHEIRECVYRGPFMDLLSELAELEDFKTVVKLPASRWKDGTPQDFVLRFFAFREGYRAFVHSVDGFLREAVAKASSDPDVERRRRDFTATFKFLTACFPSGVKTRKGATPVNLFEALAVGASLALDEVPDLSLPADLSWVTSDHLRKLTTGATNSRSRVTGRIEFCREHFLGRAPA
jgi:hypothetical protein